MRLSRSQIYVLFLGILTLAIAILTNVATSQIPDKVKPYLWYSWPTLGVLVVLFLVTSLLGDRQSSVTPPQEFSLKRYFDALRKRYQILDLDALTPPQKEEYLQIQLRSVFVEQNVRENPPPIELPKEILEKLQSEGDIQPEDLPKGLRPEDLRASGRSYYEKASTAVLDELIEDENKHVVILGDPGSGKSTLARYLILSLLEADGDQKLRNKFAGYVPILIELRTFAAIREEGKCDTFLEFLEFLGKTEGWYLTQAGLHTLLKEQGTAIVVFDGVDEVFNPEDRERITNSIIGFAASYPKVRVVVTSRIIGYQRRALTDAGFNHFTLQDLDQSQVKAFVTQWYKLALPNRPDDAESRRLRIMESFERSTSIRQLAGNPMLLTIMSIIGKHQELPRERWKLYEHAASVLIEHWDVKRHLERLNVDAPFIGEDDKKELLRRLAFRMQAGSAGLKGNYIHRDELQSEFERYLEERFSLPRDRAKTIATYMIDQFRERNFILSLYGAQVYGFVHRAFLEYFCASTFVYKFEKSRELTPEQLIHEVFGHHWQDQTWHEVLRLICGMIDEKFAEDVISYLAAQGNDDWPSQRAKSPPWNISLAIQCLTEVRNFKAVIEPAQKLLEETLSLFSNLMREEAPSQSEAFFNENLFPTFNLIGPNWLGRECLKQQLRKPGLFVGKGKAWLIAYEFGDFIKAIGSDVNDIRDAVLEYCTHKDPSYRSLGLRTMAMVWSTYPPTMALLHTSLTDADDDVRFTALSSLHQHIKHTPELVATLRNYAVEDGDFTIRGFSLATLAQEFPLDNETHSILIDRASNDTSDVVREHAKELLIEHFPGDSEAGSQTG